MSKPAPIRSVSVYAAKGDRPAQEDHALVAQDKGIFVLADGFGGPLPGAAAAKAACEGVRDFLVREAGDLEATLPFVLRSYFSLAGNVLFNALIHANRQVMRLNRDKGIHERGGTSVIAGFMDGDFIALANVGACTAWMFRAGEAVELVVPRTYGRLADPIALEPDVDARVPLMALGMSEDLEPEIFEYRVRPGDWILLHSDGLPAQTRERVRLLQAQGTDAAAAGEAVTATLDQARYTDNISVSLIIF